MYKEEDRLQKFYNIFALELKANGIEISSPVFHDYHFICNINKFNKDKIDNFLVKVYYKPKTNSFRLIIPEKSLIKPDLVKIFNITENKLKFSCKDNNQNDILKENLLRIYIDGSFNQETKKAGWAFCVVKDYQIIYEESNVFDQFLNNTRQVVAEIYALYQALLWLIKNKNNEATVYYDYSGVENWITESWKVKNKEIESIIIKIKDQIEKNKLKLKFVKVDSHSGDYYNEYVDKLAKKVTN